MQKLQFTIDQYSDLAPGKRALVDEWLNQYGLSNVHTVEKTGDDHIICYGYNTFPSIKPRGEIEDISDTDTTVVTAYFEWNSFPWEVLDA